MESLLHTEITEQTYYHQLKILVGQPTQFTEIQKMKLKYTKHVPALVIQHLCALACHLKLNVFYPKLLFVQKLIKHIRQLAEQDLPLCLLVELSPSQP